MPASQSVLEWRPMAPLPMNFTDGGSCGAKPSRAKQELNALAPMRSSLLPSVKPVKPVA